MRGTCENRFGVPEYKKDGIPDIMCFDATFGQNPVQRNESGPGFVFGHENRH
jgi:hypothetical protein